MGPARLCGIEGCRHRLGSLCHEDAAGFEVGGVGEPVGGSAQDLEQVVGALDSAVGGPVGVVPVRAENCVVAGQAAFRYSLMSPPQRAVFTTWRCLSGWSAASVATGGR